MADNNTKIIITAEDRASQVLNQVAHNAGGAAGELLRLNSAFSALGAGAAVAGLAAMARSSIDYAATLHDMAMQTGATVENLSALRNVAEMNNVSMDQAGAALAKLARNMNGVATGTKESVDAFKALGVSVFDNAGKLRDTGKVMGEVAKSIADLASPTERVAAAQAAFGKSGAALVPMLMDIAEQGELVATVTAAQAAKADAFNDSLTAMKQNLRDAGQSMSLDLLPAFAALADVAGGAIAGIQILGRAVAMVAKDIVTLAQLPFAKSPEDLRRILAERNAFMAAANDDLHDIAMRYKSSLSQVLNATPPANAGAGKFSAQLADENKKIKKEVDEFARLMDRLTGKDAGLDAGFWKDLATLHDAWQKGRVSLDGYRAAVELLVTQQRFHTDALEAEKRAREDIAKAMQGHVEAAQKVADSAAREVEVLREEGAVIGLSGRALGEYRAEKLRTAAAAEILTASQLDEAAAHLETLETLPEVSAAYREMAAARREAAAALTEQGERSLSNALRRETDKAADDAAKAWENFTRDIEQSLTDALMRSFEDGEDAGKAFVKTIENAIKTAAVKFAVQMVLTPVMGSIGQAMGINTANQSGSFASLLGGGGGGGIGNIFSLGNNLLGGGSNLYNSFAMSGAGAAMGLSSAIIPATYGMSLAPSALLGTAGMSMAPTAGVSALTGAGAGLGSAIPYIGLALGALALFGGDLFGGKEKPPVAAWTQFPEGSKDWGVPLATPWGDLRFAGQHMGDTEAEVAKLRDAFAPIAQRDFAISGLLTGEENKRVEQSIAGYTTGEMEDYSEAAMRAHFEKRLALVSDAIGGWVDEIADAFSGSLEDSYGAIATLLSVRGMDGAEELARAFIETFETAAGEAIVQASSGTVMDAYINNLNAGGGEAVVSSLSREGESLSQTFARLVTDMVTVRDAFDLMGRDALDFSLAAADMSSDLVLAAGGAEAFAAKFSAYYATFYDENERLAKHTERVAAEFDKIGISMPASQEAFRAIVDGLDLTSEAGQDLFSALLDLAPAFATVTAAAEQQARAFTSAAADWAQAYGRGDWAAAMRRDVQVQSAAPELQDLLRATYALQDQQAKRELEIQLMEAQGNTAGATAARRQIEIDNTFEALRPLKAQIWAAQDFAAAQEAAQQAAEAAASAARQAAEEQRRAADEQARAQEQLREGWQRVADSILDTMRRLRGDILGDARSFARAQADFTIASAAARAGDQEAAGKLPELARAVADLGKTVAASKAEESLIIARTVGSLRTTLDALNRFGIELPAFASGGWHDGGLRLVGERGPELEATGPARIYSFDQMRNLMGGANMAAELRALRAEVALLRQANSAENSAIANHAKTAADVLDTSARGGRSIYTRTTA